MRHTLFIILFILLPFVTHAADKPVKYKTLLSEAKAAVKNSKNQANAEKNLLAVINREDISKEQRAEIYFMSEELQRSQNDAENMKLYLKQPYDTTKFFSTILKMHEYLLACDSIETLPDENGFVKYRHRNKSREILLTYRPNLLNGGKWFLKNAKYAEAYPFFDFYLTTPNAKILEQDVAVKNDTLLPRVAYWATLAAYNANQPKNALKYIDRAIAGAPHTLRISLQEYKVRCYEVLKEEKNWIKNLQVGTELYPGHDYFYLNLMDVYSQNNSYDKGIALSDSMLQKVGSKAIYWYGRSQMLLAKRDYDATIKTAEEAIRCDSTMTDAYYNKGIAYLNKAIIFSETVCNDIRNPKCKKDRATLMELYRNAQGPMEQVRKRMPNETKRWAPLLYRIYLNLNMGDEFAEMEKILNSQ